MRFKKLLVGLAATTAAVGPVAASHSPHGRRPARVAAPAPPPSHSRSWSPP